MAVFHITPDKSVFTNDYYTYAFVSNLSPTADTFILDDGAFLIATGMGSGGAAFASPGAWTISVNGSINAQSSYGIYLNPTGAGVSTINIGANGSVRSETSFGIDAFTSVSISNAGIIYGDVHYEGGATHSLTNTAIVQGNVTDVGNGASNTVVNSGTIGGGVDFSTSLSSTITNAGTIEKAVTLGAGNDVVTNSGTIIGVLDLGGGNNKYTSLGANSSVGSITAGDGNDTITIAGIIPDASFYDQIALGGGNNSFTNTGHVNLRGRADGTGTVYQLSFTTGSGDDTFHNSGTFVGDVDLGAGKNTFSNSGMLTGSVTGAVNAFTNSSTITGGLNFKTATVPSIITNSGIIGGSVTLGSTFANTFTNSGTIGSLITLGSGNDVVNNTGSINDLDLAAGNNTYTALSKTSSASEVIARDGDDKFTSAGTTFYVNLAGGKNSIAILATGSISQIVTGDGDDTVSIAGAMPYSVYNDSIALGDGNNSFTNTGHVTVASSGIPGFSTGYGNNTFKNLGTFNGNVDLGHGKTIFGNSGTFAGDININDGAASFDNSGHITGSIHIGTGIDTFNNTGVFSGQVNFGDGTNTITNTGTIYAAIIGGNGIDNVTNGHFIYSTLQLGSGSNVLHNTGYINDLSGGSDDDHVFNSGTIDIVNLGNGTNVLINSGIVGYFLFGGDQNDTVTNLGNGRTNGDVYLGGGTNNYTGSIYADHVINGDGSDTVHLGGGDDIYYALADSSADGADTIDGGAGIDTYANRRPDDFDAGLGKFSVVINIDTVSHSSTTQFNVAANSAKGIDVGTDTISNFENVIGGSGNDTIFGNTAANHLQGAGGIDTIYGYGGNDSLETNGTNSILVGGAGADILNAHGYGGDHFIFATGDSTVARAGRDTIYEFRDYNHATNQAAGEIIDLSAIDANTTAAAPGDQAFTYLNDLSGTYKVAAEFTHQAGQLRSFVTGAGLTIEGDTNGDGLADFAIDVVDPAHALSLSYHDFIL